MTGCESLACEVAHARGQLLPGPGSQCSGQRSRRHPGGEELLEALDRGEGYDTVFLDIYMNGMDGMSAARQLRQRGSACRIVFVTSSDSFAVEGYKVQAFQIGRAHV